MKQEQFKSDQYGQIVDHRRRTIRQWFRDVWAAMRGKTWCSFRITRTHPTDRAIEWVVDCRQGYLFPIVGPESRNGDISIDMLAWNSSNFFPPALRPHPPAYEAKYSEKRVTA